MNSTITALCTSLALTSLWGIFGIIVGFLAIAVLFALGYRMISSTIEELKVKRLGGTYARYRNGKRVMF